jgi:GNAT superfamily N-acetyltransferase
MNSPETIDLSMLQEFWRDRRYRVYHRAETSLSHQDLEWAGREVDEWRADAKTHVEFEHGDFQTRCLVAKFKEHESGDSMLACYPFYGIELSKKGLDQTFRGLLEAFHQKKLQPSRIRVTIDAGQIGEFHCLQEWGLKPDGDVIASPIERLIKICQDQAGSHSSCTVLPMDYEKDISAVTEMEIQTHKQDPTSRVNFDNEASIQGMQAYYKRAAAGAGVHLLKEGKRVIGVLGFLSHKNQPYEIHISSLGIHPDYQGKKLSYTLMGAALGQISKSNPDLKLVSGVTSTDRLLQFAKTHGLNTIGHSFSGKFADLLQ